VAGTRGEIYSTFSLSLSLSLSLSPSVKPEIIRVSEAENHGAPYRILSQNHTLCSKNELPQEWGGKEKKQKKKGHYIYNIKNIFTQRSEK
jgi:hypothetical protein